MKSSIEALKQSLIENSTSSNQYGMPRTGIIDLRTLDTSSLVDLQWRELKVIAFTLGYFVVLKNGDSLYSFVHVDSLDEDELTFFAKEAERLRDGVDGYKLVHTFNPFIESTREVWTYWVNKCIGIE